MEDHVAQNCLYRVQPYRHGGTWVFDDPTRNLTAEPFVSGVPEILDAELERQGLPLDQPFGLIFSDRQFPGAQLATVEAHEFDGAWYRTEDGMTGWLCPALLRYFEAPPAELWWRIVK